VRTDPARQTFPRWHLTEGEAPPRRRGAAIIAFPGAAARGRSVITYPQALVVPRREEAARRPGASGRLRLGLLAAAAGLVAMLLV
jgi:hypothetical protein